MLALLLMVLGIGQIQAQVLYGTIVGNVTDASGAVIVGANVTATQIATNIVHTTKTNSTGAYSIPNLTSGDYRISISKEGFQEFRVPSVALAFNATARVDATIGVGTAKEVVTVNAEAAQLQTDRSDVKQEIEKQELLDIPQPSRTYQGLLSTVAGVLPPGVSAGGTVGTNNVDRAMTIQSNGSSQSATVVRIEGVDATQPWIPYRASLVPSVEAIDTVSMVTGSADSSQTLASGATVNVSLKSGTNDLHGSGYWYHQDNLWAARPYFNPTSNGPLPKSIDNDFGGTAGGPILKDKLFYFGSYEFEFTNVAGLTTMTVPTPALLQGDFTDPAITTVLYDPTSGNPDGTNKKTFIQEYGSNKVPVLPQLQPLLKSMLPYAYTPGSTLPNIPGASTYNNNKQVLISKPQHLQKIDTKFDWLATSKLHVIGRFNYHPYDLAFPSGGPADIFNLTTNHSFGNTIGTTVAATYLLSPNFVLDGSWGFTRSVETIDPPFNNAKVGATTLGIPGVNLGNLPTAAGLPNFKFTTFTGLGYSYPYLHYSDPNFSYAGNATVIKGRNSIKFGVLIQQQRFNHIEPPGGTGTPDGFTFTGAATILNATGAKTATQFNSFADFLLGAPFSWQNSYQPNPVIVVHSVAYSAFVTNTQQLTKNLTANYGVSWSYFPQSTHGSYGMENFDIPTNTYMVCGYAGIPKSCGIKSNWAQLGPHIGLAYRVTPSMVVRAGASIIPEQFNFNRQQLNNYPESIGYAATSVSQFMPVGSLTVGPPAPTTPNFQAGILDISKTPNLTFNAIPRTLQRGYTNSWNLTVEKELGPWLFEAAYVGNTVVKMHNWLNFNYAQTVGGGIQTGYMYQYNKSTNAPGLAQPLSHTNYNSMQATVQKRFSQGYTIRASYTWSKWLGLCCDVNGFGGLNTPIPQYRRLNYTYMPGDRKSVLTITGTAESPFGNGKMWLHSGLGAQILGGWQLNGSESILTGPPFGIGMISAPLFNTPGSTQRADLAPGVTHPQVHPGNLSAYYNVSDFLPANAPRFGTSSYNMLRAPGAANLDASLFRSFTLREKYKAQFRMQMFNVTNSPHFAAPGVPYADAAFASQAGKITGTAPLSRVVDSRYFQFGAKLLF
jgi:hypothetical protein